MTTAPLQSATGPRLQSLRNPWWLTTVGIVAGMLILLATVEPAGQWFYPRCLWLSLTGTECPGCGGLRAVHALLNGDIAASWQWNPMVLLLGPWLGYEAAIRLASRRRRWPSLLAFRSVQIALLVVLVVFTVWRNQFHPHS